MKMIQGHCRENCQNWEWAPVYFPCTRTTAHVYLVYTENSEFIVYRIPSVSLVELNEFHTCMGKAINWDKCSLILIKTTNDFFYIIPVSGVHNDPQNCLWPLVYYTIEWQPFPLALWVSKCMHSSHRNQLSFSPPICAKSIWCTMNLQVSMDQGHKGWFFCHIAIVLQIVTIFIEMPLAQVYFTIPTCSGFKSLMAT